MINLKFIMNVYLSDIIIVKVSFFIFSILVIILNPVNLNVNF